MTNLISSWNSTFIFCFKNLKKPSYIVPLDIPRNDTSLLWWPKQGISVYLFCLPSKDLTLVTIVWYLKLKTFSNQKHIFLFVFSSATNPTKSMKLVVLLFDSPCSTGCPQKCTHANLAAMAKCNYFFFLDSLTFGSVMLL